MSETVGQLLRATREAKGQTLEDVERVTRIRAKHLAALEADQYGALASPTHARGFLRNYAQHLGLDPVEILRRYDDARQRRPLIPGLRTAARPQPPPPGPPARARPARAAGQPRVVPQPLAAPPPRPAPGSFQGRPPQVRSRLPRLFSADVLVAAVITLVLGVLLVWGGSQLAAGVSVSPTPTTGLIVGRPTAPGGATSSATPPPEPSATPQPATPAVAYSGVNLTVRAELRAWVSVKVDGVEAFAGLMRPGEAREFVGLNVVEVSTGNGQGTRVIFNGVDQGLLGDLGEAVIRLWTLEGPLTPTPTPTPTATATG